MTSNQTGADKAQWDLSLFYDGLDSPQIEQDIQAVRQLTDQLAQDFRGRIPELDASGLQMVTRQAEALHQKFGRLSTFGFLHYALNTQASERMAFLQKITELGSELSTKLVFLETEWAGLEDDQVQHLLSQPELAEYRHHLLNKRKYKQHLLTETEEKLLAEFSPVGTSAWTKLFDSVLGHIEFGEQARSMEETLADLYSPDRAVRKQASDDLTAGLKSQLHVLTHIFNTLVAEKMIDDRLRKFPNWLTSRNLSNEIEDQTVQVLCDAVKARYDIVQRYYQLKQNLLQLNELHDYDRYAPLPFVESTQVPWDQAKDTVLQAYAGFSQQFADIAAQFFAKGHIDAGLSKGKRSGAFAHPATPDTHPFVLLNYTGNSRDVETLAHELGHGVHQWLSAQNQTYYNCGTPLTTAETASVFGEMMVFQHQLKALSDPKEKLAKLCNKLESMFATVFRQVSMSLFENDLHTARRNEGELSSTRINEIWMNTQREMFGDSMHLTDNYQTWWSYVSHFTHVPGYVYAYSFGELLVLALYQTYLKEGEGFVSKYLELLKAGGSKSPQELLLPFGIDLNDPEFWQTGLKLMEDMLTQAESLWREIA